ncbi:unnamed protein product [Pleuronectes platessa]|uniref:Uncharacterized protein n=1 Tax=Pleuronectes platessa TaxID=8262 RepID=A0A9N7UTX1_PLEPL|nr:unnamed protein product [Pleuronectes platessa]
MAQSSRKKEKKKEGVRGKREEDEEEEDEEEEGVPFAPAASSSLCACSGGAGRLGAHGGTLFLSYSSTHGPHLDQPICLIINEEIQAVSERGPRCSRAQTIRPTWRGLGERGDRTGGGRQQAPPRSHIMLLVMGTWAQASEQRLLTGALALSYIAQRLWPNDHTRQ